MYGYGHETVSPGGSTQKPTGEMRGYTDVTGICVNCQMLDCRCQMEIPNKCRYRKEREKI